MQFRRVNYKKLRLGPGDKVSPSYIRLVEKDSRLHQIAQKKSESTISDKSSQQGAAKEAFDKA